MITNNKENEAKNETHATRKVTVSNKKSLLKVRENEDIKGIEDG